MLGVIAGTGFYNWDLISDQRRQVVTTPYGEAEVLLGSVADRPVAFLPRHAKGHTIPPHRINYRANIFALREVGVARIAAINAVGSLEPKLAPGEIVLVDDFLDFTWGREHTFFDGSNDVSGMAMHADMSDCYCSDWQQQIMAAAARAGVNLHTNGVYVATQGPRFETRAEIRSYALQGGTVVGMTGVPEVNLAVELGLCYASLAVVTNYACGIGGELSAEEIFEIMAGNKLKLEQLLSALAADYTEERACTCGSGA